MQMLALLANGKQELQEWNGLFTRHDLKLNLEKTKVLHIDHQREELEIELEGKELTQRDSFVYLGGVVCGEWRRKGGDRGKPYGEEYRPERTRGEQLRGDGRPADLKKTKEQGHEHLCHTGMPDGTETLALTELQQQRRQVCENNWVRKIARATRAGRRRMVELREETGVQRSLTERLMRSRLRGGQYT